MKKTGTTLKSSVDSELKKFIKEELSYVASGNYCFKDMEHVWSWAQATLERIEDFKDSSQSLPSGLPELDGWVLEAKAQATYERIFGKPDATSEDWKWAQKSGFLQGYRNCYREHTAHLGVNITTEQSSEHCEARSEQSSEHSRETTPNSSDAVSKEIVTTNENLRMAVQYGLKYGTVEGNIEDLIIEEVYRRRLPNRESLPSGSRPNLRFKACRINGKACVELFEDNKVLALVWERQEARKEYWGRLYKLACEEAERLNLAINFTTEAHDEKD